MLKKINIALPGLNKSEILFAEGTRRIIIRHDYMIGGKEQKIYTNNEEVAYVKKLNIAQYELKNVYFNFKKQRCEFEVGQLDLEKNLNTIKGLLKKLTFIYRGNYLAFYTERPNKQQ